MMTLFISSRSWLFICLGWTTLAPSLMLGAIIDMRDHRVPSKQPHLLRALGLADVALRTEERAEVDRGIGEEGVRNVLYLPSSPTELALGLDMLFTQTRRANADDTLPSFWNFVHPKPSKPEVTEYAPGYYPDCGQLVLRSDTPSSKRGMRSCLYIDLSGLLTAYDGRVTVLPTAPWQAPWQGSLGLTFAVSQGTLVCYFPTRYNGRVPVGGARNDCWGVDDGNTLPEVVNNVGGKRFELTTVAMLHALTHVDAPKWDALWVFYDSALSYKTPNVDFSHSSVQRDGGQVNDYIHHQTLRLSDCNLAFSSNHGGVTKAEASTLLTRMWPHMKRFATPPLEEQFRNLKSELDVPYLAPLEAIPNLLDTPLYVECPFTFRELSLLSAYGNFHLPLTGGDFDPDVQEDSTPAMGDLAQWAIKGSVAVYGGAALPVPDGLWDGRFLLFPHAHAHMLTLGHMDTNCNEVSPFDGYSPCHPKNAQKPWPARFLDGVHCGFADINNCWNMGPFIGHSDKTKTATDPEDVALLMDRVWSSPGRFYYVRTTPPEVKSSNLMPVAGPQGSTPMLDHNLQSSSLPPPRRDSDPTLRVGDDPSLTMVGVAAGVAGAASAASLAFNSDHMSGAQLATTVAVSAAVVGGVWLVHRLAPGSPNDRNVLLDENNEDVQYIGRFNFSFTVHEYLGKWTVVPTCSTAKLMAHDKSICLRECKEVLSITDYRTSIDDRYISEQNTVLVDTSYLKLYRIFTKPTDGRVRLSEVDHIAFMHDTPPAMDKVGRDIKKMVHKLAPPPSSILQRMNCWTPVVREEEGTTLGYIFIGDVTPVAQYFTDWHGQSRGGGAGYSENPLSQLHEAIKSKLLTQWPESAIEDWWDSYTHAKAGRRKCKWLPQALAQYPELKHVELRIVAHKGFKFLRTYDGDEEEALQFNREP